MKLNSVTFLQLNSDTFLNRGVFRISSRGWQSNFQGVAKISQGVAKKMRATLSAFDILDTCYKEIHKIYFFHFFLFVFYLLYASLIPHNVLCLKGVEIPSNGQGVARGAAPPPWNRLCSWTSTHVSLSDSINLEYTTLKYPTCFLLHSIFKAN